MRQIVSTPDILGGTWHLDGHRISVVQLREFIWLDEFEPGFLEREYPHLNLTDEEREAIKAWTFPAILEAPSFDTYPTFDVICRCGECVDLPPVSDVTHVTITCDDCGRRYELTLTEVTDHA